MKKYLSKFHEELLVLDYEWCQGYCKDEIANCRRTNKIRKVLDKAGYGAEEHQKEVAERFDLNEVKS